MEQKKPSPPPKRGPQPKVAGAPATSPITVKLTEEQKLKLRRLGGGPWVRAKIDAEPEPPSKE